jgi:hypothetical protein
LSTNPKGKLTSSNENPIQTTSSSLTKHNEESSGANFDTRILLREKKTLSMRHWFKFLLPYLNANTSNTTTMDNNGKTNLTRLYFLGRKNHHRHNSTLNSTQKSFFKNLFNLTSPLVTKLLLNVSLSNRTESGIQNKLGSNVILPNVTNETRVFLFRQPVMKKFMFKILDFSNEQTMDDTNNGTNVSSGEINSNTNNKAKFLHQQNSRRQNFTINSNFNNNNNNSNNGQVEIVFKLKSILKDIFKF